MHISGSALTGQAPEIGQARVKEELRLSRIRADQLIAAVKLFIEAGVIFEEMDTKEKWHDKLLQEVALVDPFWIWWVCDVWQGKPPLKEKVIEIPEIDWDSLTDTEKAEAVTDFDISDPRIEALESLPDHDLRRMTDAYQIRYSKDGSFDRARVIKMLVDIGLSPSDLPPD